MSKILMELKLRRPQTSIDDQRWRKYAARPMGGVLFVVAGSHIVDPALPCIAEETIGKLKGDNGYEARVKFVVFDRKQ
jgi:hypothetical protein